MCTLARCTREIRLNTKAIPVRRPAIVERRKRCPESACAAGMRAQLWSIQASPIGTAHIKK
jgi:hypothetical protein